MAKGAAQDWLLMPSADGGTGGVASRSTAKPIKTANFPVNLNKFNDAETYSEWIFEYAPSTANLRSKPKS